MRERKLTWCSICASRRCCQMPRKGWSSSSPGPSGDA
uniref:Uncharacterized protein n=1 Tax=Arundo donax TaxID=35708 RepID=A0A0A9FAN8_ARUDO